MKRRFGREIKGLDKKNSKSAAYNAILGENAASRCGLEISGLFLTVLKKGSSVRMNISGERGQPSLVPLLIPKKEDT